jgi:hypothetical protein
VRAYTKRVGGTGVTVKTVEPLMAPEVAFIPVSPHVLVQITDVVVFTNPVVPTVATAGTVELQVTEFVRSWMLPLVKVPMAVNCLVTFLTM